MVIPPYTTVIIIVAALLGLFTGFIVGLIRYFNGDSRLSNKIDHFKVENPFD